MTGSENDIIKKFPDKLSYCTECGAEKIDQLSVKYEKDLKGGNEIFNKSSR